MSIMSPDVKTESTFLSKVCGSLLHIFIEYLIDFEHIAVTHTNRAEGGRLILAVF